MWILFAFGAAGMWSVVNIIDKYILSNRVRQPLVPLMINGVIGITAAGIIFSIHGFDSLAFHHVILAFVTGVCSACASLYYYKAVQAEEISRVIPLLYTSSLFVALLAGIFLGEIFTLTKYLGVFLLMIGAMLITVKDSKITFGRSFWLVILCSAWFSVSVVLEKYLLTYGDFWTIFSYEKIGQLIVIIPVGIGIFSDFVKEVRLGGVKVVGLIAMNESLNVFAGLSFVIAASIGFVTLVNAFLSLQPFLVLLLALVLSVWFPRILKEEITRATVFIKLGAVALVSVGAFLLM